jgi:hypothetical protein
VELLVGAVTVGLVELDEPPLVTVGLLELDEDAGTVDDVRSSSLPSLAHATPTTSSATTTVVNNPNAFLAMS